MNNLFNPNYNPYPRFNPSLGNLTDKIRYEYIMTNISYKKLPGDALDNSKITSLVASNNPNDEVFFGNYIQYLVKNQFINLYINFILIYLMIVKRIGLEMNLFREEV
jgi:hypothetical protein